MKAPLLGEYQKIIATFHLLSFIRTYIVTRLLIDSGCWTGYKAGVQIRLPSVDSLHRITEGKSHIRLPYAYNLSYSNVYLVPFILGT
jgi:hypothetical protein